ELDQDIFGQLVLARRGQEGMSLQLGAVIGEAIEDGLGELLCERLHENLHDRECEPSARARKKNRSLHHGRTMSRKRGSRSESAIATSSTFAPAIVARCVPGPTSATHSGRSD